MTSRIPITVITGFLGSGKTTLLNQILDQSGGASGKRIAVIENEFAAAFGIENEILHQDKIHDIQNLYEFGMGCVCCSSSGELINALVEIAMRNEHEPIENRIQHVILETTGLADPTPIFQLITQGANRKGTDEIVQNYYVSGIVTLVDAKHFLSQQQHSSSDFKNEWLAQILTTDTVVINKVDLLSNPHDQLKDIKEWIHQHNPSATIYTTSYSKVPIQEAIFDIKSNIHIGPDAQQMAEKQHDPSVEQTMLLASGPVDMDKVRAFIKDTTQNYQIYRVKGVFVVKDSPYKWVVQGVGSDDVFITQHGEWEQGEAQESRLTLIGRDVMKVCSPLENEFRKCIV